MDSQPSSLFPPIGQFLIGTSYPNHSPKCMLGQVEELLPLNICLSVCLSVCLFCLSVSYMASHLVKHNSEWFTTIIKTKIRNKKTPKKSKKIHPLQSINLYNSWAPTLPYPSTCGKSQLFMTFWKAKRMRACQILGGRGFHRVRVASEKVSLDANVLPGIHLPT